MRHRKAFTLIELLVVIAIIALLISIIVPALKAAKEAARKAVSLHNLSQISLANATYADGEDGRFVSWEGDRGITNSMGWKGPPWCINDTFLDSLSQITEEVMQVSEDAVDAYVFPKKFRCPSAVDVTKLIDATEGSLASTTYAGNYTSINFDDIDTTYVNASTLKSPFKKIMFLDSADICMIVTRADYIKYWDRYGEQYDLDSGRYLEPAYRHNEGANGSFADGHVEYRRKQELFYYIDDIEQANNGDWERNKHMWSFTGDDPAELW